MRQFRDIIADYDKDNSVIELSSEEIFVLLKWFDGNIFNQANERIKYAIDLLKWCNDQNDLDVLPLNIRSKYIHDASNYFKIPTKKLIKLYQNHMNLLDGTQIGTKLVAFEGIDGTGKTVQIDLLKKSLEKLGYKVGVLSFPVYDSFFGLELGKMLSGELLSADQIDAKSMCLWYALDRFKALEYFNFTEYDIVLLNRFTLSSAVYQSVRSIEDNKLIDWIFDLEHNQLNLPVPDLYIVFDLNPNIAKRNVLSKGYREYVGNKEDVYEKSNDLILKARDKYKYLSNLLYNIVILDCMQDENYMKSIENINLEIMEKISAWKIIDMIH